MRASSLFVVLVFAATGVAGAFTTAACTYTTAGAGGPAATIIPGTGGGGDGSTSFGGSGSGSGGGSGGSSGGSSSGGLGSSSGGGIGPGSGSGSSSGGSSSGGATGPADSGLPTCTPTGINFMPECQAYYTDQDAGIACTQCITVQNKSCNPPACAGSCFGQCNAPPQNGSGDMYCQCMQQCARNQDPSGCCVEATGKYFSCVTTPCTGTSCP